MHWYQARHGVKLDRSLVLPVLKAIQGHPEAGRLWEEHINKILFSKDLNFTTTTHDHCIYRTVYNGEEVFLLRQTDDFAISCKNESTAITIFDIIGKKLQLRHEDSPPFDYFGKLTDFNGVEVNQCKEFVEIACTGYIDRVVRSHGWDKDPTFGNINDRPTSPLPDNCIHRLYESFIGTEGGGFKEGTTEHKALENEMGFAYRTVLGELMFAYVCCRLDIAYAITTPSKFSTCPTKLHYQYLVGVVKYLHRTRRWGIRYYRTCKPDAYHTCLPHGTYTDVPPPLPSFFKTFPSSDPSVLTCFVDAAYANDPRKRRSTTGYALMMAGGAVVYRSKTQAVTALSSTEAEFFAAVAVAKVILYLRSVLRELHMPMTAPTIIYEDNEACIKIINSDHPTDRTRHIDTPFFRVMDWRKRGDLRLKHIAGILNPADSHSKPTGWVLHTRNCRRMMGHYNTPTALS